ncbi:MAG TPA: hypothetical protein VIQ04_06995 [Nitrososphaeraceae archaeon]
MSTDLLKKEETILNNNYNFIESLKKELSETTYGSELIEAFLYPPYKRLHQTSLDLEKPESDYTDSYSVEVSL